MGSLMRPIVAAGSAVVNVAALANPNKTEHWPARRRVLGHTGRYREALELGETYIDSIIAAFGDEHLRQHRSVSGYLGLGHAYAALGRPDDARRMYGIAREACRISGDDHR